MCQEPKLKAAPKRKSALKKPATYQQAEEPAEESQQPEEATAEEAPGNVDAAVAVAESATYDLDSSNSVEASDPVQPPVKKAKTMAPKSKDKPKPAVKKKPVPAPRPSDEACGFGFLLVARSLSSLQIAKNIHCCPAQGAASGKQPSTPKITNPYYYKKTNTYGLKMNGSEVIQAFFPNA